MEESMERIIQIKKKNAKRLRINYNTRYQKRRKIKKPKGSVSTTILDIRSVGKSKILNKTSPIQELGPR